MATAYLGLGSNLGNREANLRAALRGLWRMGRAEPVSALYETDPVGPVQQPPFYNAACRFETGLEPLPLMRFLKGLEHEIGRRPGVQAAGPRPIDIDLLLYDDLVLDEEGLEIPHPRLAERAFVLVPLADVAADIAIPAEGKTVGELLAAVGREGVRRVAEGGWDGLEGIAEEKLRL